MLFNSYPFLFVFFPIVLVLYFVFGRFGIRARLAVILCASLFFYGWWDVRFLLLLATSILTNYGIGRFLESAVERGENRQANLIVTCGVAFNLIVLGIFKYANFFVDNVNALTGTSFTLGAIILPLGISFFTFEQIGFLVDIRRGHIYRTDLLSFSVFVSFFPRLVAGPILRYGEIGPQLKFSRESPLVDVAIGLTIFFIGLFKKTFLADGVAPYATPVFVAAANGEHVDLLLAWGGVLAFACQLYFDFSGYSDMAIGAARCFGIRFPMNFASPYKATSIIEFWRRWHITLSRFLRDYLYFPLGGNRRGRWRRHANLMTTMLLGGLWHGASWTFVLWGGLHGLYLVLNHSWIAIADRSRALTRIRQMSVWAFCSLALTFIAVVVAWTFFRSPTVDAALNVLAGMSGQHGIVIPSGLAFAFQGEHDILMRLGVTFAEGSGTQLVKTYLWLIPLLGIVFLLPNSQEILARYGPVLEMPEDNFTAPPLSWAPIVGLIAFIGIISITRVSEFLYWQF